MENYCTIYAHTLGYDQILATLQKVYPHSKIEIPEAPEADDTRIITIGIPSGLLGRVKKLQISYEKCRKNQKLREVFRKNINNSFYLSVVRIHIL